MSCPFSSTRESTFPKKNSGIWRPVKFVLLSGGQIPSLLLPKAHQRAAKEEEEEEAGGGGKGGGTRTRLGKNANWRFCYF